VPSTDVTSESDAEGPASPGEVEEVEGFVDEPGSDGDAADPLQLAVAMTSSARVHIDRTTPV
jgi:hypothetical protein